MAGLEGVKLEGIGVDTGDSGAPEPTDSLFRHTKVPPTVVISCAAFHPLDRCRVHSGVGIPI